MESIFRDRKANVLYALGANY